MILGHVGARTHTFRESTKKLLVTRNFIPLDERAALYVFFYLRVFRSHSLQWRASSSRHRPAFLCVDGWIRTVSCLFCGQNLAALLEPGPSPPSSSSAGPSSIQSKDTRARVSNAHRSSLSVVSSCNSSTGSSPSIALLWMPWRARLMNWCLSSGSRWKDFFS